MRTTLTLDDDVYARLRGEVRANGQSLEETVNSLSRQALSSTRCGKPPKAFQVHTTGGKLRPGLSYQDIGKLLAR